MEKGKLISSGSMHNEDGGSDGHLKVPVIDFKDLHEDINRRKDLIEQIKLVSETWGFFQAVNHGVPEQVIEEMIAGLRSFFELPEELKQKHFSGHKSKLVNFTSKFGTHRRDSLYFSMSPDAPDPEAIPADCREIAFKYAKLVKEFGISVLELLSEGLQLKPGHLVEMGCAEGLSMSCHYYETRSASTPDVGLPSHKDVSFIGLLVQDQTGGLQILHQNQWIDVPPIPGALVVNIGDIMQLITNDKFKSIEHRVMSNNAKTRVSMSSFLFSGNPPFDDRLYGPMKELVSEENPAMYKHLLLRDYVAMYMSYGPDGPNRGLDNYRL